MGLEQSPGKNSTPGKPESAPRRRLVLVPTRGLIKLDFRDLWEYRDLMFFLAWRDISVRYKQTILGILWAVLQPLLTMIVFTLIFGGLAKIPSDSVPYPIFSFCALLPWQFFSTAISSSADSLVGNANLISKVFFPRLVIPLSSVLPPAVDFAVSLVMLAVLMLLFGVHITWNIIFFPLFIILAGLAALGFGLWLSALNVQYRDIRYVVPFLVQFLLFLSPIAYPTSMVPDALRILYALNPIVGVVEGFRWSVLGTSVDVLPLIVTSVFVTATLLATGAFYFRNMERTFSDII